MERITQVVFITFVVLAHTYRPCLGREPAYQGQDHAGPSDIFDPLHIMSKGSEILDPLGLFHHRHHGMDPPGMHRPIRIQTSQVPLAKEIKHVEKNEVDNIKVTTENAPFKITLLPKVDNSNNTVEIKINDGQLGKEEKEVPKKINSTLMIELLGNDKPVLRTNANKTVITEPNEAEMLKSKVSTTEKPKPMFEKQKLQEMQAGDSIVFPDDVDDAKSEHKDTNEVLNKTTNVNVGGKLNYTKNSDGKIVFPLQIITTQVPTQAAITPPNPVQSNETALTVSSSPIEILSPNYVYQAMPITNDIFPNRAAMYTTSNKGQGPLYTNVVNTFPQNGGQPFVTNNNINTQNPISVVPSNQYYLVPIQNGNYLNTIPSNNNGIVQNPQNLAGATLLYNPNSLGNSQPFYNGQQQLANAQSNNVLQQEPNVTPAVTPYVYNQGNISPQSNYNSVPNNIGIGQQTFGQTYVPNNVQQTSNGQPNYLISNGNQLNNYINNDGQPIILNPQGNPIATGNTLPDNTQKYMLVNLNQQNTPQNGQGNGISLQNGQLVALVPRQLPNNILFNNNGQPTQQPNSNLVQQIQSPTIDITNQPNMILMNTASNNAAFLNPNGQNSFTNGQNLLTNGQNSFSNGQNLFTNGQNVYKLVAVPNGNQLLNAGNLIALKDKEDRLHATKNNR